MSFLIVFTVFRTAVNSSWTSPPRSLFRFFAYPRGFASFFPPPVGDVGSLGPHEFVDGRADGVMGNTLEGEFMMSFSLVFTVLQTSVNSIPIIRRR